MKTTDKAVVPQTTRTKYDAVLLTIRSRKSFFEVTQAIEMALPRFHIPKLMEYVTHGDRAGVEAYVDSTSKPFSIFWDFEQGSTMRLCGDSHRVEVLSRRERCNCTWAIRVQRCRRAGRSRAHLRFPAGRGADKDRHGQSVVIF